MRPDLQRAFIDKVTPESYERFKDDLDAWLGFPIEYRVCEMPIFVSHEFRRTLEEAAVEIIRQCVSPTVLAQTHTTLQPHYTVPHEAARPLFSVVDFAVCKDDGAFVPKLIELQGFPSLFGYQYILGKRFQGAYELGGTAMMSGLDDKAYLDLLNEVLFAGYDKASCALIEVDPLHQKTRPDFRALELLLGLQTLDITTLVKDGQTNGSNVDGEQPQHRNRLFYTDAGGERQRLCRVFNRAIVDELDDLGITLPFAWTDDLDVEWAGHPNWYFRISKAVMPWLRHPSVPTTVFLHEVEHLPENLTNFVLKPLFSFAGKGVIISPTKSDIDVIPLVDRHLFVLQERVVYEPCIATPYGDNKVEIRVMLIWPDSSESPIPVMSLARTGRGVLMGARYNTDPWTGSSGCLFV